MKLIGYSGLLLMVILLASCDNNRENAVGSGFIEATEILISAESAGKLDRLYCDEGSPVSAGDTLGMVDTVTISLHMQKALTLQAAAETQITTAELAIKQAEYNHSLAKKEYDRVSALIKTGSANQQMFDQAETAFNLTGLARQQANAALQAARADLARVEAELALLYDQRAKCFPTAPVNGVIVETYIDAGELVSPGKALAKLARLDTVWVKVYVPPANLTEMALGDQALVDPEDGRQTLPTGYITHIADQAEFTPKNVQTKDARADLVYAVKITVPNQDGVLKIGMPVTVYLP